MLCSFVPIAAVGCGRGVEPLLLYFLTSAVANVNKSTRSTSQQLKNLIRLYWLLNMEIAIYCGEEALHFSKIRKKKKTTVDKA